MEKRTSTSVPIMTYLKHCRLVLWWCIVWFLPSVRSTRWQRWLFGASLAIFLSASVATTSVCSVQVLNKLAHDNESFTEGFLFHDGYFFESVGLYNKSRIRKMNLNTSNVVAEYRFDPSYFAEGLVFYDNLIYALTYKSGKGFVFPPDLKEPVVEWNYQGEGWGISVSSTAEEPIFYISNGSSILQMHSVENISRQVGSLSVVDDQNRPVAWLNELEWVEDELWANIWYSSKIARINVTTGTIKGWIDLQTGDIPEATQGWIQAGNVPNGIAYNMITGSLWITGKWWPTIYQVQVRCEDRNFGVLKKRIQVPRVLSYFPRQEKYSIHLT